MLLAFFFSLQIVTNNAFAEDVLRIPSLVEHYQHHQEKESHGLSFLDFITLHYGAGSENYKDIDHHSLPLKHSSDVGHVHVPSVFTVSESGVGFSNVSIEIKHVHFYTSFIPNNNLESIFQPPKSC